MMGRMTLQEVRAALAAAKAKMGAKAPAVVSVGQELESLARRLEWDAQAGKKKEQAEPDADGGGRSRRTTRPRGRR